MSLGHLLLAFGLLSTAVPSVAGQTWEPSSGPEGGTIHALATLDGTLFAATGFGVYRSRDSGSSWALTDPRLNDSVHSLAVLGGSLFAATDSHGVFRSDDAGETWVASSAGLSDSSIWSLGAMGHRLFAGTGSRVFYSDDYGLSWVEASTGLHGLFVRAFAFRNTEIYAGLSPGAFPGAPPGGGVYKSTDGGISWVAASEGLGSFKSVLSLIFHGDTLLAGTYNGLFRSLDGGVSWVPSGLQKGVLALADAGYAFLAGTSDDGVYQSVDGGLTWSQTALQGIETDAVGASDGLLYAGTPSGVFVSSDQGSSWKLREAGMANTYVTALFTAFGTVFAVTRRDLSTNASSTDALFGTADGGRTWSRGGAGLPNGRFVPGAIQGGAIYFGVNGLGVYKSLDRGQTWSQSSSDISTLQIFALGGSEAVLLEATDLGLFRSTDGGASWIRGQVGIPADDFIHSFAFTDSAAYAGGNDAIYKSVDEGKSWTPTGTVRSRGGVVAGTDGELFAFDVFQEDRFFVSHDGGASWRDPDSPPPIPVNLVKPIGNALFVAGSRGIYVSLDGTRSWQPMNLGLAATNIAALGFSGTELFAAVPGYGVQTLGLRPSIERPSLPQRIPHVISRR